jgi:hypothetical protein
LLIQPNFARSEPKAGYNPGPPVEAPRGTGLLIDTGSSGADGGHALATFITCPRKYALDQTQPYNSGSEAAARGTLWHVASAHYLAQHVPGVLVDGHHVHPEDYLTWEDAIRTKALRENHRDYQLGVPVIQQTFSWAAEFWWPGQLVLWKARSVEQVHHTATLPHVGIPWRARIDLEVEGHDRRIYWVDYKTAARIDRAQQMYARSIQLIGQRHLGEAIYGDRFGGILVMYVSVAPGARVVIEPHVVRPNVLTWAGEAMRREYRARQQLRDAGIPAIMWPGNPTACNDADFGKSCGHWKTCD